MKLFFHHSIRRSYEYYHECKSKQIDVLQSLLFWEWFILLKHGLRFLRKESRMMYNVEDLHLNQLIVDVNKRLSWHWWPNKVKLRYSYISIARPKWWSTLVWWSIMEIRIPKTPTTSNLMSMGLIPSKQVLDNIDSTHFNLFWSLKIKRFLALLLWHDFMRISNLVALRRGRSLFLL